MILHVKVRVGRGKLNRNGDNLTIFTEEPMKNNRANYDIIKQVANNFHVNTEQVRILRGFTSRNKLIELRINESDNTSELNND